MNIGSNIRRISQLFIVLFLGLSGGLVYWQVYAQGAVTANVHNSRPCQYSNAPLRGNIYDRNGILLAYSTKSTDRNACGYVRHYTDPSLAGLIGYYVRNYAPTGLEAQYNSVLAGTSTQSALTNTLNSTLHESPIGNNIYLTIDDRIQKIVAQDFQYDNEQIDNNLLFQSNRGSVVVTDPHTGEILALLSEPGFDPNKMVQTLTDGDLSYFNQLSKDAGQPLIERPLQALYTPGSTFKTVTLLAALDSGKSSLNQQWNQQQAVGTPAGPDGGIIIGGSKVTGNNLGFNDGAQSYTFHFPITTEYAYANSDNLVFAQIGVNTGQNTWLNYTQKMYFDKQVPFDLPVAKSSVKNANGDPLSQIQFASGAFGQGVDNVTPLQMSLVDNTVANDGVMMQPMLISKITNATKQPLQTNSPKQLSTVVSQNTARQVQQAMVAVAKCGGGYPITDVRNTPWGMIGKTGTGEVGGGLPAEGWFITAAPYYTSNPDQMPALTIVAMKENAGEGAYAVGPMEAKMYNDIFSAGYIKVTPPANPDSLTYCVPRGLIQTP
ncbi:MAG TPA: penicillin-binding transpeptidase domain-containing protein [Dictyobacter sp.]|jgi:peptidoglycan glycosyltransferase|nr:penicillin-binding transpeptidase domain-containing protein [Dictyobacter sp.]